VEEVSTREPLVELACDYCETTTQVEASWDYGGIEWDVPEGWYKHSSNDRHACPACVERIFAHTRKIIVCRGERPRSWFDDQLDACRYGTAGLMRLLYAPRVVVDDNCPPNTMFMIPHESDFSGMQAWMPEGNANPAPGIFPL
jgi:hypothetical protein